MHWIRPAVAALAVAALLVGACGGDDARPGSNGADALSGSIIVAAAASLTDAMTELGEDFATEHPGADVTFTFDASSALVAQIRNGAPADVFASADEASMQKLVADDLVDGAPVVFAHNALQIVTKPGNPKRVTGLAGLATVGVVALCTSQAPCGRFAEQALAKAGVAIPESRITRGQNVRTVLGAVGQGDAEAGIVYLTDVLAAGPAVTGVVIPAAQNVVAAYPIAVVKGTSHGAVARAFVEHVRSPEGLRTLQSFGFAAP